MIERPILGAQRPPAQSLLLAWPHRTTQSAGYILPFAPACGLFRRQQVRAGFSGQTRFFVAGRWAFNRA